MFVKTYSYSIKPDRERDYLEIQVKAEQFWYMEAGNHLDSSYGVWSKVEGERSLLNERQLSLLAKWHCKREKEEILGALILMFPEVMRLYRALHKKAGLEANEVEFRRIIERVL